MLHAGVAAALADRLVERVAARLRAELATIGLAEAADRVGGELHLAHRHEVERAHLADRALRLGIEGADRFQRVAEEVEPHRLRHAGREKVDDAAAHRIFAGVAHRASARKPLVSSQATRSSVDPNCRARPRRLSLATTVASAARAAAAAPTVVEQDARPLARGFRAREARQHRHAPRRDRGVGRHAVVGLAVPGREIQHLDIRRKTAGRPEVWRAAALSSDMQDGGPPVRASAPPRARREIGKNETVLVPSWRNWKVRSPPGRDGRAASCKHRLHGDGTRAGRRKKLGVVSGSGYGLRASDPAYRDHGPGRSIIMLELALPAR